MTTASKTGQHLLAPDEPAAVRVERVSGRSPYFLICDHAGNLIPRRLVSLGLPAAELARHIAWDIGAAAVALRLGELLDATVIQQRYSRLVIDCNRPPSSPQSIVTVSERTSIPGNANLTAEDRARRHAEIFAPYHERITAELDRRQRQGQPTLLLAMHSFTPVFLGTARAWHAGMLYNRDARLAHALGAALRADPELVVGDNQPYAVSDATDYAIPEYGERRGLPHVEIEIRQDLIAAESGAERWASLLARLLPPLVEPLLT